MPQVVHFRPEAEVREAVERLWQAQRQKLLALLPGADVQHVGSTAVPGSLTKGDVDIQVRVPLSGFAAAEASLAQHYARNPNNPPTADFASFKDDAAQPPLGIQLTAIGGAVDGFYRTRDVLNAHPPLREAYDALKRGWEGREMSGYRSEKARFFDELEKILAGAGG